jgi:hypothetical protein
MPSEPDLAARLFSGHGGALAGLRITTGEAMALAQDSVPFIALAKHGRN